MPGSFKSENWYGFKFIQADQAKDVPGLREMAASAAFGLLAPGHPVFYAHRRTDAPYPDVVVGLPVDRATVTEVQRGNRAVVVELLDALEDAYAQFIESVQAGKPE